MNGATYTYEMESEIRGYHVYGSSWKPKISDLFLTDREVLNEDDKFAVAVYEELGIDGKRIVGHLPVEFSRIAAYFIENGGEISCSDWKKEALQRPTRRNGYSVQAVLDVFEQETC